MDALNGDGFVFLGRTRKLFKVLRWQNEGFVIYAKKLELGRYSLPQQASEGVFFENEMERTHVPLKLLWEEYITEYPGGYSLTQFRYHYRQHMKAKRPVSSSLLKNGYSLK